MVKCPNCEVVMNEVLKSGINIDVCPKCMGVWLDKGELDKIIQRSKEEETYFKEKYDDDREKRYYDKAKDYRDEDFRNDKYYNNKGYPRKKGSFLEDLFDF